MKNAETNLNVRYEENKIIIFGDQCEPYKEKQISHITEVIAQEVIN